MHGFGLPNRGLLQLLAGFGQVLVDKPPLEGSHRWGSFNSIAFEQFESDQGGTPLGVMAFEPQTDPLQEWLASGLFGATVGIRDF